MDGLYTYINNHYREVFGKIHGPIVGEFYAKTIHPDDTQICVSVSEKCFQNPDKTYPATIRKHDGKGGYVITQWEYKAMFDDAGNPAGMFCLGFDISDYMQQSKQLQDAQSLLDQKDSVLKEIAFNQSHVIRRPLANILGLAMILEKMEVDQNLKNIIRMLLESSQELDAVIKDIVGKTYI